MPRKREPNLVSHVREHRAAIDGLTQAALAERIGVTRQTIVALEGGGYVPSLALALRLAKELDQPIEALFELDE